MRRNMEIQQEGGNRSVWHDPERPSSIPLDEGGERWREVRTKEQWKESGAQDMTCNLKTMTTSAPLSALSSQCDILFQERDD
jgi:hypothetical protein